MALARHHAAAQPGALGFLYIDGHTRAYFGKRQMQKMHVTRLKFPGPATRKPGSPTAPATRCSSSWRSRPSLAAQMRDLLPQLRQVIGEDGA